MPLVRMQYDPRQVSLQELSSLDDALRGYLARELSCEESGQLETTDFEIHYLVNGPFDSTDFAVVVDIEAMDFPSRVTNKDERADNIRAAFEGTLSPNSAKVAVWLKLVNAAWSSPTA